MSKESFAIINELDQVVNHILVDKDAPDFEEVMAGQLARWGCVRYVETTNDQPVIILDPSPEIWTTHTDAEGFVLPQTDNAPASDLTGLSHMESWDGGKVFIKGREYPTNSLLLKENADKRPVGWVFPEDEEEVSLADAD